MHGRLLAAAAFLALAVFAPPASAVDMYGLTDTNGLHRFETANPSPVFTATPITGVTPGETLIAIDTDPLTGTLYGYSDAQQLYTIEYTPATTVPPAAATAVAIPVGTPFAAVAGTEYGMDIDPTQGLVYMVTNAEKTFRFTRAAGGYVSGTDVATAGNIVAAAYSNNFAGGIGTQLYVIDATSRMLHTADSSGGAIDPGKALGITDPVTENLGFDIAGDGVAYASITTAAGTKLHEINLDSGLASDPGATIGDALTPFQSIAAKAFDVVNMADSTATVTEGETLNLTVNRTGPKTEGLGVIWNAAGDVSLSAQNVTWDPGQDGAKQLSIPVPEDTTDEPNGTFTVTLQDQNGLVIPNATTTVTILDDDDPPVVTAPTQTQTTPAPTPTVTTPTTPAPRVMPPPVNRAPKLTVSRLASKRLSDLSTTRGRFLVKVKTNEACRLTAELRLTRKTAKALKIGLRIARTQVQLRANRQTSVRLRPVVQIRKKLRSRKSVSATVWLSCADSRGKADPPKTIATTLRR